MTRMTREASQAQTRARLLESALALFSREGFHQASVDRIAEAAGFSKGAFYSNFSGKDAIYLEVLETYGEANLRRLLDQLAAPLAPEEVVARVAAWAAETAKAGNWAQLVLEYARSRRLEAQDQQATLFRGHWRQLGKRLTTLLDLSGPDPEYLGALVFELTYAPAMSFMADPGAGELVRLALEGIIVKWMNGDAGDKRLPDQS
jgi:AcrR family transcriptional regulator